MSETDKNLMYDLYTISIQLSVLQAKVQRLANLLGYSATDLEEVEEYDPETQMPKE